MARAVIYKTDDNWWEWDADPADIDAPYSQESTWEEALNRVLYHLRWGWR